MSRDHGTEHTQARDHVDVVVAQWQRERPDLDVWPMGLLGRLGAVRRRVQSDLCDVFAEHGLEGWEFDVLATLRRNGEPHALTPGELLASMMVSSGAMTNRIDRLARRGLVERRPHPDDGRQVLVRLTDEGCALVDAAVVDHVENLHRMAGALDDDEQQTLDRLLRRLHEGLVAGDG